MNRSLRLLGLMGLMLLNAATAHAGHGHGGGWHVDFIYGGGFYPRPWYPSYYYYPPPVVYAPPPVYTAPVYSTQVVVPLAQTTTPAASPTNVSAPTTTLQANVVPSYRGRGVTLRNPPASGGNVAFVVDSRTEVELKPGDEVPLDKKNAYFVEFDRGGDYGTVKRTLTEGAYEFVVTSKGWDLQKASTDDDPIPTPVVRRNALPTTR